MPVHSYAPLVRQAVEESLARRRTQADTVYREPRRPLLVEYTPPGRPIAVGVGTGTGQKSRVLPVSQRIAKPLPTAVWQKYERLSLL